MTLSQCANACLRNSRLVAFLYDFDTQRCRTLTNLCKETIYNRLHPNVYMYDKCKYTECPFEHKQLTVCIACESLPLCETLC